MAKESLSPQTIAKGVGAAAILAASLGALQIQDYSKPLYVPGTYSASAKGLESDVVVTVTVDGSSITGVTVNVSGETPGIGAEIGEEVSSQIISSQSAEIDGVAGASITSDAVRTALTEALGKAADGTDPVDGDAVPEESSEAGETVAESATEAVEAVSEAAESAGAAAAGSYTPGTYTASAAGIESDVTVEMTFDENGVTAASVDVSGETAGIGAEIGDEMADKLVNGQSASVDGVAGATITSNAVIAAAEEIFAQAAGGASSEDAAETAVSGGSFTPGTYTASAPGIESDVTVEMTFDEAGAADVSIDVSGETAGIGAEIGDEMAEKLLAAQSAEIDGVAGATITSNAVIAAAQEIFSQAAAAEDADTSDAAEETAPLEDIQVSLADGVGTAEFASAAAENADAEADEAETEEADTEEAETEEAAEPEAFVPGTYTASAAGIESDVVVEMTFDDNGIADVSIDVSGETPRLGAEIGDEMAEKILTAQSAKVDGVAGATITSNAVLTAVKDIFAQAAADTSAASSDETAAGSYTPGTYTASAAGIESDVLVEMTFDENGITDVSIDVSGETAGIGAEIGDEMVEKILAAQNAEIDGVAGATITSDAVITAVKDILSQAAASDNTEAVTENAENAEEITDDASVEVVSASDLEEVPAGFGVAVLSGSDETPDVSDFGTAVQTAPGTEPVAIDETKAGVGVASL